MIPIFVYGTLREGLHDYERVLKGKTENIVNATIEGFDMLNLGTSPGIITGSNIIVGEVVSVAPNMYLQTLQLLDRLEGYNPSQKGKSRYHREIRKVTLEDGTAVDAYVYIYNVKLGTDYPVIDSGDWVVFEGKSAGVIK